MSKTSDDDGIGNKKGARPLLPRQGGRCVRTATYGAVRHALSVRLTISINFVLVSSPQKIVLFFLFLFDAFLIFAQFICLLCS